MGIVSPSKMPKAKTITRKDDPNEVSMYAKGGKVKKFAGGGSNTRRLEDSELSNFSVLRKSPKKWTDEEAADLAVQKAGRSPENISRSKKILLDSLRNNLPPSSEDMVGRRALVTDDKGKEYIPDIDRKAKGGKANWIKGAIKKPGALRSALHAKKGEPIPAGKLAKAAKAPGKLGQRARFAEMLKGFKKK